MIRHHRAPEPPPIFSTFHYGRDIIDAIGADRIPDPTTAGDFCRRFTIDDVETLQDVFDQTRVKVWKQQPSDFFDEAVIDADGTLVATGAGCKQGVDIAYDGTWVR